MLEWREFLSEAGDIGEIARRLVFQHDVGLAFLATLRLDDGGPRVHPVCPFEGDGRLFVAIARRSPKSRDLRADPRYMLHAFPADRDAEFSMRGAARLITEPHERAIAERAVSFASGVKAHDDVFSLEIDRADTTTWENWARSDTYAVRRRWVAPPK